MDTVAHNGDDPSERAWKSLRAEHVKAALSELPSAQREVMEMVYFHGPTQSEVAKHTGQPLGTVKSRLRLGLIKLRTSLRRGRDPMTDPTRHDEIRGNLPAFALGGLGPEEEAAVRKHLDEGCDECRRELASYEPLAHALNLTAPDIPLPEGAKGRLMERAAEVRPLPTVRRPPQRRSRLARLRRPLAVAAVAAAVLAGGLLFAQNRQLDGEIAEKQQTINGVVDLMERADLRVEDLPTTSDDGVRARVYTAREGDVGMFVFDRLPPLPESRVYQLWVGESEGLEESVGTFTPTDEEKGSYHKLLSPPGGFDDYGHVGISVVPRGGLEAPPPPGDPAWVVRSELPVEDQASAP